MMRYGLIVLAIAFLYNMAIAQNYSSELAYLQREGKPPADYIVSKFSNHNIVLLGEDHAIKEDLDLVRNLIPQLYAAHVYNLGMEFGAYEMQGKLDSLVTGDHYSDDVARAMMFYYNIGWAYKEYTDIYRAAWEFNRTLPAGARKFRIINISYQYNWVGFQPPRTPENMAIVFPKGTPDDFRANLVAKEVDKGEKILLLVGVPHAFTKYKPAALEMNNNNFCRYDDGWLGNRLIRKYPGKVFNIFLHSAFYSKPGRKPWLASPANGAVEAIFGKNNNKPLGFDLVGAMGNLPDSSAYSTCYPGFTLGQLFDGYVFLKPFFELNGCTLDTLYFKGKTWDDIGGQIPDPDWRGEFHDLAGYWKSIATFANIKLRYADLIANRLPYLSAGSLRRFARFPSQYVQPRNVDVWLPDGYDPARKYAVLYMHDGQMLFDSTLTWNRMEWKVDEHVSALSKKKLIRDCIVVGIWNNGEFRHTEYFPQKALDYVSPGKRDSVILESLKGKPMADNYLRFLVTELKPFIDKTFSTLPDKDNTFIAGSSMGGLISMYAMCEYPSVFGAAACLSTHWVGDFHTESTLLANAFNRYMAEHLPSPADHRFYFDYGTATLDRFYPALQKMIDKTMQKKGYRSSNWSTREFAGADHSEKAWNSRLDIPLTFLLKK